MGTQFFDFLNDVPDQIVSIQLMSPASGDNEGVSYLRLIEMIKVSIQLMSPASGDSGVQDSTT